MVSHKTFLTLSFLVVATFLSVVTGVAGPPENLDDLYLVNSAGEVFTPRERTTAGDVNKHEGACVIAGPQDRRGSRSHFDIFSHDTIWTDWIGPLNQLHTMRWDLRATNTSDRTVSGLTLQLMPAITVKNLTGQDVDTLSELMETMDDYYDAIAPSDPDMEYALGITTDPDWCDRCEEPDEEPCPCGPSVAVTTSFTSGPSPATPTVLCPGDYIDFQVTYVGVPQLDDVWTGLDYEGTMLDFCFDARDVQDQYRDGVGINTNSEELAEKSNKPELEGVAADGVTPILLRFAAHGPGTVNFTITGDLGSNDGLGRLSEPATYDPAWYKNFGADVGTLDVATVPVVGDGDGQSPAHVAFVVLTAPPDYARPAVLEDDEYADRELTIDAEFTPSGDGDVVTGQLKIKVVRPAIMLLHGLWGSAAAWRWPFQIGDDRFTVHIGDYKESNMWPWSDNVPGKVRSDVRAAIQKLRDKNIAVTQADVFTSSMGGLLMRKYIADDSYIQDDNFGQGDIHKFISVDTPHKGSPWANELVEYDGRTLTTFGSIVQAVAPYTMQFFGVLGCVNCGAVGDLRTDSPLVTNLPATPVRCHAMVGDGGHDFLGYASALAIATPLIRELYCTARFLGLDIEDDILGTEHHDFIVTEDSQLGGLSAGLNCTTTFDFSLFGNWAIHLSYGDDEEYADKAVELIHRTLYGSAFANEFPAASKSRTSPPNTAKETRPITRGRGDEIEITSPTPGTIVTPGSTLPVTVEPTGGYVPVRTLVLSPADSDLDTNGAPFEMTLGIPDDAIGDITLLAFALDAGDVLVESDPVTVHVNVPASLTGLSVIPDEQFTFAYCPGQSLRVMGHYDDGVDREITSAALGTTYATDNPFAATVDSNGFITTYYVGSATITVTNGDQQATTDVNVIGANGDADSDADVDLTDYVSFHDCTSGPGVAFSPLACEVMDFDHDGDVDVADFAGFQLRFTGNPDCNGNGVSDSADIASRNSLDLNFNGVPDECEGVYDCNTNGIDDACDLGCDDHCATIPDCGSSEDCQTDGIPDECQL